MFKIESIDLMLSIAERVEDRAAELMGVGTESEDSLERLATNIQCNGISETLHSLSSAIKSKTQSVNELFSDCSDFIETNGASIGLINQDFASGLSASAGNLENIGK